MSNIPSVTLNDGSTIQQLGFGVFRVPNDQAKVAVAAALKAGYRAIDTAAYYKNEVGTGAAIAESDVPREQMHLTTKVWHTDLGYDATRRAFDTSMQNLKLDYLDLYLIHWPVPSRDLFIDTWRAMEKIQAEGQVRSIGVSNFPQPQLQRILDETDTKPVLNQVELHPWLPQATLREFHRQHGIATQAWSPLGHGQLLDNPVVKAVAERRSLSPAQVLLRWNLDLGTIVISKSVTPEHIRANLTVFDIDLTDDDRAQLGLLSSGRRTGPDPDRYGI